jgi:hypothetical protein
MSGFGSLMEGFMKGWKAGNDTQDKKIEREYKRLRAKVLQRQMDKEDADTSADSDAIKARKLKLQQMERTNGLLGLRAQHLKEGLQGNQPKSALPTDFNPTPGSATTKYKSSEADGVVNWDTADAMPDAIDQNSTPANGGGLTQMADAEPAPAEEPAQSAIPTPEYEQSAARGGKIRHFARGGSVTSDDEDVPDEAEGDEPEATAPTSAIPTQDTSDRIANDEVERVTDFSSRRRGYSETAAHDAVLTGVSMGQKEAGLFGAVQTTNRSLYSRYQSGGGGIDPKMMEQIYKKIDPKNELSESERTMKAMGSVWQYYVGKGDVDTAKKAATAMVGYYRGVFNMYKNFMKVAAENGDVDNTMKAALKAYANVPNGEHATVKEIEGKDGQPRLQFSVVDENGKTVSGMIGTPPEILRMATDGRYDADMDFDKLVASAAAARANPKAAPDVTTQAQTQNLNSGTMLPMDATVPPGSTEAPAEPEAAPAPAKAARATSSGGGKKGSSPEDKINAAFNGLLAELTPKPGKDEPPLSEEGTSDKTPQVSNADKAVLIKAATHIASEKRNEHLLPSEVIATTAAITNPEIFGTKPVVKTEKAEGGYVVTYKGNDPVFIPRARFEELASMGVEKMKAATAKKTSDAAEAAKPGLAGNIRAGIKDAVGSAVSATMDAGSKARGGFAQLLKNREASNKAAAATEAAKSSEIKRGNENELAGLDTTTMPAMPNDGRFKPLPSVSMRPTQPMPRVSALDLTRDGASLKQRSRNRASQYSE